MERQIIQDYINNFRRYFARYLKPSIGLSVNIYPTKKDGTILEFSIGTHERNEDDYKEEFEALNEAFSNIKQSSFGGDLSSFAFLGTNIIMEDNRIILIKDSSKTEWNDKAAKRDVEKIVTRG